MSTAVQSIVSLLEQPYYYPGYMHGFKQAVVKLCIQIQPISSGQVQQLQQLQNAIVAVLPDITRQQAIEFEPVMVEAIMPNDDIKSLKIINFFTQLMIVLQQIAGFPVFAAPRIIPIPPTKNMNNGAQFSVWIPLLFPMVMQTILDWTLSLFNHSHTAIDKAALKNQMKQLINQLKLHAPQAGNTLRFLNAAHALSIPWKHIAHNVFQFGHGKNACWLDSSLTSNSAQIAVNLVKNKYAATNLLRAAGFPTPPQALVPTVEAALSWARQYGDPVVIKPMDQDTGQGVYANLLTENSVRKAYKAASLHSKNILIEKHIPGKDYRLLVLRGEVIWAIERTPGGVVGDGMHTIQQLLDAHHQRHKALYPLRYIRITEDTHDFLAQQGYTLASIPKVNCFVPLNRVANITMGGTPRAVFTSVHPDNLRLVTQAARLLRLDLAGVDFISPDIAIPYHQNDGTILEINAQPQLGSTTAPHIYSQILTSLLPRQGRIPIIFIYTPSPSAKLIDTLYTRYRKTHAQIGMVYQKAAWINNEKLLDPQSCFLAGQSLLLQDNIDLLLYVAQTETDITQYGLPFDRFDTLMSSVDPESLSPCVQRTLLQACCGEIVNLEQTLSVS